jgi:hypothetical protein
VRLCSERSRCCGANLPYRERPLGWSVRLRPHGAHTSFLRGLYVGPRLLVTRQERSRKREPPGAEPARGLCAGDRDPGPRSGRSGKRLPHTSQAGAETGLGVAGLWIKVRSLQLRVFCATRGRDWEVPAEEPAYLQSCMPGQGHARSRPRALCPSPPWCQLRCLGLVVDSEILVLSSSAQ